MKRTLTYLALALGVALLVSAGSLVWDLPRTVELALYNRRMEALSERQPSRDIVIVDIDEASMQRAKTWPWPRSVHAELVRKLHAWGATVIAFDVYFLNKSNPADDAELAAAVKAAGNVVMADMFSEQLQDYRGDGERKQALLQSLPELGGTRGYVNYPHDLDGQIRATSGLVREGRDSFAYAVLKLWRPDEAARIAERYGAAPYLIHYSGPPQTYTTVSYSSVINDVLDPRADPRVNANISVPAGIDPEQFGNRHLFKDKVVLVGASAVNLHDIFATPFVALGETAKSRRMPGVEIHANHIDTLLNRDEYREAPGWVNLAVTAALSVVFALLLGLCGPLTGLLVALALGVAYMTVNAFLFMGTCTWLSLFDPLAAIAVDYGLIFAYRFFIEEKEKRRVRGTLNRYVSPKAVNELLKDPGAVPSLRSERRQVSILFSDIAGFTTLSEQLPVDDVERILNDYLTAMTQIVFDNEGTLDKYIGDAVMAVWGNVGPIDPQIDALRAAKTAIEMQEKLNDLRQKWLTEGLQPLQVRIGINTGEALCGNFGSPLKMDFTVIGDAVNTASRLEGLNKEMNTGIMISQATYELVKDYTTTRYLGPVSAKGKAEKILVYELQGWRGGEGDPFGAQTRVIEEAGTQLGQRLTKMGTSLLTGRRARPGDRPSAAPSAGPAAPDEADGP